MDHAPMARIALLLGGMLTRRLGGGRYAQGLAGLAVLVMPIRLAIVP